MKAIAAAGALTATLESGQARPGALSPVSSSHTATVSLTHGEECPLGGLMVSLLSRKARKETPNIAATIKCVDMASVKIDPMRLPGPWANGYVLERQHTLSSEFLGHDGYGNPQFDTKRSELGELVFRLKNRNDKNAVDSIGDTAVEFLKGWGP